MEVHVFRHNWFILVPVLKFWISNTSDGVTFDSTYNQKNIAYFATKFARDNIVPWKKHAEIARETVLWLIQSAASIG